MEEVAESEATITFHGEDEITEIEEQYKKREGLGDS